MYLVEHTVVEVLSKPYYGKNHWFVDVKADCYGSIRTHRLVFSSLESAMIVKVGYQFEG